MKLIPYFDTMQLLLHFNAAINAALEEERISEIEARWLSDVSLPEIPTAMRAQLITNLHPSTLGGLAISPTDPAQKFAYFFNPLEGLRIFETFDALHAELLAKQQPLGLPAFTPIYNSITDNLFSTWFEQIVHIQALHAGVLSAMLGELPGLRTMLAHCMTSAFKNLLPTVEAPAEHYLQLVDTADKQVLGTLSLGRRALDMLANVAPATGRRLRYLDADDTPIPTAMAPLWEAALARSVAELADAFQQRLNTFWSSAPPEIDLTRRQLTVLALADDYARAVLRAHQRQMLSAPQLQWLLKLLLPRDTNPHVSTLEFFVTGVDQRVHLAGVLVIQGAPDDPLGVFMYSPASGVRRFASAAALKLFFLEAISRSERSAFISLDDWQRLHGSGPVSASLRRVRGLGFAAQCEAIIALLERNVLHCLAHPEEAGDGDTLVARLDGAMDIRGLLDWRLTLIDNNGRWLLDGQAPSAATLPEAPLRAYESAGRANQIDALRSRLRVIHQTQPGVTDCIGHMLAPHLAVITEGFVRADSLQLQYDGLTSPLPEFFLKRLCGAAFGDSIVSVSLSDREQRLLAWPDPQWVMALVDRSKGDFSTEYTTRVMQRYDADVLFGSRVINAQEQTRTIYETLLRLELAQERQSAEIDSHLLDAFEQVLDSPNTNGRYRDVRVRNLYLRAAAEGTLVRIHDVCIVQSKSTAGSKVLLWSTLSGLREFESEEAFVQQANASLQGAAGAARWATLVAPEYQPLLIHTSDQSDLPAPLTLALQDTSTHLVANLSDGEHARAALATASRLTLAIKAQFTPRLFERFVRHQSPHDRLDLALTNVRTVISNNRFLSRMPAWLGAASAVDLWLYYQLLEECVHVANDDTFYLADIPDLNSFAREKLQDALRADNPSYPDPDHIQITLKHLVAGLVPTGQGPSAVAAASTTITKSLTEFSLTHFNELATATMYISSLDPQGSDALPSALYLRALVDRLDVGKQYRAILQDKLSSQHKDYGQRRAKFAAALLPNLLAEAFQRRLEGTLTAQAVSLVANVIMAPDAGARTSLAVPAAQVAQLHLQASTQLSPDPVQGMYLLSPVSPAAGPLVLYVLYESEKILQEFTDEAALLSALQADKALQRLVLGRIAAPVRSRYEHNGLLHPHVLLSSGDLFDFNTDLPPVRLARPAIGGNFMHVLFDENIKLLLAMADSRTVTTAERDWQSYHYLMTLGLQQSSVFLPGKLALLVNSWQSVQWLQSALDSAAKQDWGRSAAEFLTALATLATLRDPRAETLVDLPLPKPAKPKPPAVQRPAASNEEVHPVTPLPPSTATLLSSVGAPGLRERIRLQAVEVVLADLRLNPATQLYHSVSGGAQYVAIAGRVYQVRRQREMWRVVNGESNGPVIRLKADGQWEFELGLRGGGIVNSTRRKSRIDRDIATIFNVQAAGIPAIQSYQFGKYIAIRRAHAQARYLLVNTISHLNGGGPTLALSSAVTQRLNALLGVVPSAAIITRLRRDCQLLLGELLSPSMSPESSRRYVVGMNRPGRESTIAFRFVGDSDQRIFFSELFFRLEDRVRINSLQRDLDLLDHHQAVTLLHELSHQVLGAADIAYVGASYPYLDLLETTTASNQAFYQEVRSFRRDNLSATTPRRDLFTLEDNGMTRDFSREDGAAKSTILRVTNETTLEKARHRFLTNAEVRANLILSNADSIALLISEVGRYPA